MLRQVCEVRFLAGYLVPVGIASVSFHYLGTVVVFNILHNAILCYKTFYMCRIIIGEGRRYFGKSAGTKRISSSSDLVLGNRMFMTFKPSSCSSFRVFLRRTFVFNFRSMWLLKVAGSLGIVFQYPVRTSINKYTVQNSAYLIIRLFSCRYSTCTYC